MYDRLAGSVPQALWVEGDYVLPWELGSRERSVLQGACTNNLLFTLHCNSYPLKNIAP